MIALDIAGRCWSRCLAAGPLTRIQSHRRGWNRISALIDSGGIATFDTALIIRDRRSASPWAQIRGAGDDLRRLELQPPTTGATSPGARPDRYCSPITPCHRRACCGIDQLRRGRDSSGPGSPPAAALRISARSEDSSPARCRDCRLPRLRMPTRWTVSFPRCAKRKSADRFFAG